MRSVRSMRWDLWGLWGMWDQRGWQDLQDLRGLWDLRGLQDLLGPWDVQGLRYLSGLQGLCRSMKSLRSMRFWDLWGLRGVVPSDYLAGHPCICSNPPSQMTSLSIKSQLWSSWQILNLCENRVQHRLIILSRYLQIQIRARTYMVLMYIWDMIIFNSTGYCNGMPEEVMLKTKPFDLCFVCKYGS